MHYALLIYVSPDANDGLSDEQRAAISTEYWAIRDDPRVIGGAHLRPVETATTVRDSLVTDGPFANTKEVFGGFYLVEADDLDAVLEITRRIPAARAGGGVEIRPLAAA
jgi:hypothetical protein